MLDFVVLQANTIVAEARSEQETVQALSLRLCPCRIGCEVLETQNDPRSPKG